MKAAYLITSARVRISDLVETLQRRGNGMRVRINDANETAIESFSEIDGDQFMTIEEETYQSLSDEWEESDPIFARLLENDIFNGVSRAFYVTTSHAIAKSQLFRKALEVLVRAGMSLQVYDCGDTQIPAEEYLDRMTNEINREE